MSKQDLITALEKYSAYDAAERGHVDAMLQLLRSTDQCFERSDFPAHVVGGGWLISSDGQRTLLTRHKYLNRWLQFGGHADGDTNIMNVAMRETLEESGVRDIAPVTMDIFDIDVHEIPANPKKNEPAHMHYEFRYLLRANDDTVVDPECEVQWFTPDEMSLLDLSPSMIRTQKKWQDYLSKQK